MFKDTPAFASFAVPDLDGARAFYAETLGLDVTQDTELGILQLSTGGGTVMVYPKPDYTPATYTVLNFAVPDLDAAVDGLAAKGVRFERYDAFEQDDKGIARGPEGPAIAWFTDPAGNIFAVMQAP